MARTDAKVNGKCNVRKKIFPKNFIIKSLLLRPLTIRGSTLTVFATHVCIGNYTQRTNNTSAEVNLLFPVINECAEHIDLRIVEHTTINNTRSELMTNRLSHLNRYVDL
jgi:hypothetical protein